MAVAMAPTSVSDDSQGKADPSPFIAGRKRPIVNEKAAVTVEEHRNRKVIDGDADGGATAESLTEDERRRIRRRGEYLLGLAGRAKPPPRDGTLPKVPFGVDVGESVAPEEGRGHETNPKQDGGESDRGNSETGRVDAERETKIDTFLRGRYEQGIAAKEERTAARRRAAARHRHLTCQGPCGAAKPEKEYSVSQWPDPHRICLACQWQQQDDEGRRAASQGDNPLRPKKRLKTVQKEVKRGSSGPMMCLWEGCDRHIQDGCNSYCGEHRQLQCHGCGVSKTKMVYSSSQWSNPRRICLACQQQPERYLRMSGDEGGDELRTHDEPISNPKAAINESEREASEMVGADAAANAVKPKPRDADTMDNSVRPQDADAAANSAKPKSQDAGSAADAKYCEDGEEKSSGPAFQVPDDEELLPPRLRGTKHTRRAVTPYGRLRSCMCPNPSVCREIVLRWVRLQEGKYVHFQNLPGSKAKTPAGRHTNAYRVGVLRSLGYSIDGSEVTRTTRVGKQVASMDDKIFSERLSIIHFHPEVMQYITRAKECKSPLDRWRVPIELGQKLGLKEEDKCPGPDSIGKPSFFALPNYSLEQARADVERAEKEFIQKARDFHKQNAALLADMVSKPAKYVTKIHEQEQRIAALLKSDRESKCRAKKDLVEKKRSEQKSARLLKGLEKLARRMDKWESTQGIGGASPQYAREIYKWATGKDLSEEGFFGVEPSGIQWYGYGARGKGWIDPRFDRAVQARWEDPSITLEEALRIGGFELPPLGEKGVKEKEAIDTDGVTVTARKHYLHQRLRQKKKALKKKAETDPEAAREYDARYPEAEVVPEGVYGTVTKLDLRGVPNQPLVLSKRSATGYRGVKPLGNGTFSVSIGAGENGKCICLGTFKTAEEAANVYARATFYQKQKKDQAALSQGGSEPAGVAFSAVAGNADGEDQSSNGEDRDNDGSDGDGGDVDGNEEMDTEEMKVARGLYCLNHLETSTENYCAEHWGVLR